MKRTEIKSLHEPLAQATAGLNDGPQDQESHAVQQIRVLHHGRKKGDANDAGEP